MSGSHGSQLADTKVDLCQGAIAPFTETHPYCPQYLVINIYFCDNVSDKPYLKKKEDVTPYFSIVPRNLDLFNAFFIIWCNGKDVSLDQPVFLRNNIMR